MSDRKDSELSAQLLNDDDEIFENLSLEDDKNRITKKNSDFCQSDSESDVRETLKDETIHIKIRGFTKKIAVNFTTDPIF